MSVVPPGNRLGLNKSLVWTFLISGWKVYRLWEHWYLSHIINIPVFQEADELLKGLEIMSHFEKLLGQAEFEERFWRIKTSSDVACQTLSMYLGKLEYRLLDSFLRFCFSVTTLTNDRTAEWKLASVWHFLCFANKIVQDLYFLLKYLWFKHNMSDLYCLTANFFFNIMKTF